MNQCIRIMIIIEGQKESLHALVKKYAQECALEGMVQAISDTKVRVVACGNRDNVDMFIDALHKGVSEKLIDNLEVEPFMKDRDYRGVFRVIE